MALPHLAVLLVFLIISSRSAVADNDDSGNGCPPPLRLKPCTCRVESGAVRVDCRLARTWYALRQALSAIRHNYFVDQLLVADVPPRGRPERTFRDLNVRHLILANTAAAIRRGTLPKSLFRNASIEALSLDNIGLRRIPSRSLEKLPMLKELVINRNANLTKIGRKSFRNQNDLLVLNLRANGLTSLSGAFLERLPNLEILDVGQNAIGHIRSDTFVNASAKLKSLDLSSNPLRKFESAVLLPLKKLEHLSLAHALVGGVLIVGSFAEHLPNLKSLDISGTNISLSQFHSVPLATAVLQYHGDFELNEMSQFVAGLQRIDIRGNTQLRTDHLRRMNSTFDSVFAVDFSRSLLSLDALAHFPNLRHFYFEESVNVGNRRNIQAHKFMNHRKLQTINMHGCEVRHINPRGFRGLEDSLEQLRLSNNELSRISNRTFMGMKRLKLVDLSNNFFIDVKIGKEKQNKEKEEGNEKKKKRQCKFPLDQKLFHNSAQTLETLLLSGNALVKVPKLLIEDLLHLKHLSLASNEIRLIEKDDFKGNTNLEVLDLSDNRIIFIHKNTFVPLKKLKHLSLSYNELTYKNDLLPDQLMFPPALEELKLSEIGITKFNNPSAAALTQLVSVDLSQNDIRYLHADVFAGSNETLVFLDLRSTRLECSCDLRPFVEWLSDWKVSTNALCYSPAALHDKHLLSRVCWTNCAASHHANRALFSHCAPRPAAPTDSTGG